MFGIQMGAVISTTVGHKPEPVVIGDIADIQEKIGGHFDCVTVECGNTDDGSKFQLVGYVHDEGRIMNPPLEMNLMASMIFNRELHGTCVILSGTNPETSEDDGESYDLPSKFFTYLCETLTKEIEKSVMFTQMAASAMCMAERDNVITQEQCQLVVDTINELGTSAVAGTMDTIPSEVRDIMKTAMDYMVAQMMRGESE